MVHLVTSESGIQLGGNALDLGMVPTSSPVTGPSASDTRLRATLIDQIQDFRRALDLPSDPSLERMSTAQLQTARSLYQYRAESA